MVYEPLHRDRKYGKQTRDLRAFSFLVSSNFLYFGGVFNKTISPFALVGYEIGYSQLVSNARS